MNSKIPIGAIVFGKTGMPAVVIEPWDELIRIQRADGKIINLTRDSAIHSWVLPDFSPMSKVWLNTLIETADSQEIPFGSMGIIQEKTSLGYRVLFGDCVVVVLRTEIEAHPGLLKMSLPKPVAIADLELYGASLKTHGIINPQVGSIVRLHPGTGIIAEVEGTGFLCRIRVTDIEGYTDQRVVSRWFPLHGLSVLGMEITPQ
jgi:hypothetical protein